MVKYPIVVSNGHVMSTGGGYAAGDVLSLTGVRGVGMPLTILPLPESPRDKWGRPLHAIPDDAVENNDHIPVPEVEDATPLPEPEDATPLSGVVEAPEVQRYLEEDAAAPDATTSQNIVISMAAVREQREQQQRKRGPLIGGIVASVAAVALLGGAGYLFPGPPQLSRSASHTMLRNAGAAIMQHTPEVKNLPANVMLLQKREVVRTYTSNGISYNVVTNYRTIMDRTSVEMATSAGKVEFSSPRDEKKWKDADSPTLQGVGRAVVTKGSQRLPISTTTFTLDALHSWPTDPDELSAILAYAVPGVQPARAAMLLLTVPGLPSSLYHGLYLVLARVASITVVPTPVEWVDTVPSEATTVKLPATKPTEADALMTFDPRTGQVFVVQGATPQDTRVTVQAAGFLNCVDVEGKEGPSQINLGCATGSFMLKDLRWKDWGTGKTVGRGIASINDCDPSCAEGTFQDHPVVVTLSEPTGCGYGVESYTRLKATFPEGTGKMPATDVEETFPCRIPESR